MKAAQVLLWSSQIIAAALILVAIITDVRLVKITLKELTRWKTGMSTSSPLGAHLTAEFGIVILGSLVALLLSFLADIDQEPKVRKLAAVNKVAAITAFTVPFRLMVIEAFYS